MTNKTIVEFNGNLKDLTEFLELNFKDPYGLTLAVSVGPKQPQHWLWYELVDECLKQTSARCYVQGKEFPKEENLLRAMPSILSLVKSGEAIQAIKDVRSVTNCLLKEAKDIVEGPIKDYLDRFPEAQY